MIFRTVVIGEGGCDNCGSIGIGEGEGGFVGIREILPVQNYSAYSKARRLY